MKKRFMLYDKNGETLIAKCDGLKDLYTFLGRSKSSVQGTVWRIEQGRFDNIRDNDGNYYKLEIIRGDIGNERK